MAIKDIYDGVYPILLTTATFGLSSILVQVSHNGHRRLKIYNALKILNILYLTLLTYLLYSATDDVKNNKFQRNYASGVSKIGIIFQLLSQILLIYIIYFINITKCGKILSYINDIKKIDEIFGYLGEEINYRKHFIYEISVISTGIAVIFGRSVMSYVYMKKSIVADHNDVHFIFFFPDFVSFLLQNYFIQLVTLLYERFTVINKLLQDNLRDHNIVTNHWKIKESQNLFTKHAVKRVELIMELHDRLTDAGNKINDSFSLQILSCFTSQFLKEVFTSFYLYYESLVLKNRTSATVWLIWLMCTTFEIFYVTVTCHLTSREAKVTGIAVHKILIQESDPLLKRKLMIFSHQLSHRSLQFSACGLFSIDATLIFTIAGAAATYLLIMLQFQEGIEAQCANTTIG